MKLISRSLLLMTVLGALMMSGCNTVDGFGRDVSATGHGIQRAAD